MKKLLKTLILVPMFPLIWLARNNHGSACGERARAMLRWRGR